MITHIDTVAGHDAERERLIKAIVTLHAAQRVGEAHQLAAEASAKICR
jgi:hypothetical protein